MPNIFLGLALPSILMLNSKFQSPGNSFISFTRSSAIYLHTDL